MRNAIYRRLPPVHTCLLVRNFVESSTSSENATKTQQKLNADAIYRTLPPYKICLVVQNNVNPSTSGEKATNTQQKPNANYSLTPIDFCVSDILTDKPTKGRETKFSNCLWWYTPASRSPIHLGVSNILNEPRIDETSDNSRNAASY